MFKLKTASLKEFQKRASQIQANTLLPILSNLRIQVGNGVCTLTKNSLNAVVIGQVEHETDTPGITLLIDERILFSIVATSRQEIIEIQVEGNQIIIIDEDKTHLPLEDIANFPKLPIWEPDAATFKLEANHIAAIRIASKYINDSETAGHFKFVHLGAENIYAFHNNYFYINSGFANLPNIELSSEETAVITSVETIDLLDLPNHHVFFTPGYEYIFTKSESSKVDVGAVMTRLQLPGKDFTTQTEELNVFIQRANSISESPVTSCSLVPAGMFIKLTMNDANYSRSNERMVACTGEPNEFTFNSRLIAGPLKAIPYPVLKAKTNQNCLIVQEGEEWFCFLGMAK